MPILDPDHESGTAQIYIGNVDVTGYAVWAQCNFQVVASAQPGSCVIVLRDHLSVLSFIGGELIKLYVAGDLMWQGYAFTVEQGYWFDAYAERRWTIRGVDLNILLQKLILYNHTSPTKSLDGGGAFPRDADGVVGVPINTTDKDYIAHMLNDTDFRSIDKPVLATEMTEVGTINPDGKFTPPQPGITLYDFMVDVSANVMRTQPGSVVWYMSPAGHLVYKELDTDTAPFYVSDDPAANTTMVNGVYGVNVRSMSIMTDISRIKNDVLLFTGNLDPSPESPQEHLLYKHNQLTASVNQFGRFQYSEILSSDWLQGMINVRSTKILYQEGTPATQVTFITYRHGFYPGQLVNINSKVHTFWVWNMDTSALVDTHTITVPIRGVSMRWVTPTVIEYSVTCSFDTQDPWGLILALKRPANRGLVPPTFWENDLTKTGSKVQNLVPYSFVREYPEQLSGNKWRCSYGYIRYSLTVFTPLGVRIFGTPDEGTTVGFLETDPSGGVFQLADMYAGVKPLVEYHVAGPRT